jgi:phage terminase large subunit
VFKPFQEHARYKGAHGGRGSGKSHNFAELMIEHALAFRGLRSVCIREIQRTLKESSKRLIEDKLISCKLGSADGFKVFNEVIQTPGDGIITFTGMQDATAESIKSLEGYGRAWIEEAQTLSHRSLALLRPTIREPESELWFGWNPRRKTDAVDDLLRTEKAPTGAVVLKVNWSENPWFPAVLEQERQDCLNKTPEQYDHIWEGGYATILEGAYYARSLAQAKADGRIGRFGPDELLTVRLFVDIGGTGARADAFTMWAAQFVGREIRCLKYYEAVGQPIGHHLDWLRSNGYTPERAQIWLPHDGDNNDSVYDVSYKSAFEKAGYEATIIPNQGKGAAMARIQCGRRMFPNVWFNDDDTKAGREALGWYHEKKDEVRNIGLGPEHDWCFEGSTEVLTPSGWKAIADLAVHNEVVTPCGNKRIIRSGIVRMTDKWITTKGIRSTPEHRFFTKRGLVEAKSLRSTDEFWTRESWGLKALGSLCAALRLGFMAGITSATPDSPAGELPCSYTGWSMRLCMAAFQRGMRFIMSMMTHSTTTPKISPQFQGASTGACTSPSQGISAFAKCAAPNSAAIRSSHQSAAQSADARTTQGRSETGEPEPAHSLTIERDECYFVRGSDGRGYLVSNSSHGADSFGLMCVVAESHSGHGSEWWHDWKKPVNNRLQAREDYGTGYRRAG